MRLSYVIVTHNREQALNQTLPALAAVTPLSKEKWEALVVDGDSLDPGPTVDRCTGKYVVVLYGHSMPADMRSVAAALSHLDSDPRAGAVVGPLLNADGSFQAPALPSLLFAGASWIRKSAIERVGGFPKQLSTQAADYELSFRLWHAGFRIDRREDISIRADAKSFEQTADLASQWRDELIVMRRHFPSKLRRVYWHDWCMRFKAMAALDLNRRTAAQAITMARFGSWRDMMGGNEPMSDSAIEEVLGFRKQATIVGDWARRASVWRVVLGDFSENIWATFNACRSSGLQMRCISDNNPAYQDHEYRGLPIVHAQRAFEGGGIDGVILTTLNPAKIAARIKSIRQHFRGPILPLWEMPKLATKVQANAA